MITCCRCKKETESVYRHIAICGPCNALVTADGLLFCNGCESACKPHEMARRWLCKACAAANQRDTYAANAAYRAQVKARAAAWRATHPEHVRTYLRGWVARNPEAVQRYQQNAAYRARENARRRERYATDPTYRARCRVAARAYWPHRAYKLRVIGRRSQATQGGSHVQH